MSKQRLGKGLTALIPDLPETEEQGIREVNISEIAPNRDQPRQNFDREKLEQLAQSIIQHGIVQPVVLRQMERGYEIVAGERRWRAARIAGLKTIPAVVKDLDEKQVMEMALIENLQREDLNPMEEAEAYRKLIDEYGLTQEEIASIAGKSRPAIANTLRLLNLPEGIQQLVRDDKITAGHARAVISLSEKDQHDAVEKIIKDNLSVRETEKLADSIINKASRREGKNKKEKEPWVIDMENSLGDLLGTRVQISQGRKKGKIEIEYYSAEELERILEFIRG